MTDVSNISMGELQTFSSVKEYIFSYCDGSEFLTKRGGRYQLR